MSTRGGRRHPVGPVGEWLVAFDDDRAASGERRQRTDRREDRQQGGPNDADREWHLDERRAVLVLDDQATDISLTNQLLDLGHDLVAVDGEFLYAVPGCFHDGPPAPRAALT